MDSTHRFPRHQGRVAAAPSALRLREARSKLTEQARRKAPDPPLSWHRNNAVAEQLALLFRINDVHLMAWIKEPQLSTQCLGNLTRVWRDVWGLWCNGNEHLHKEVAGWHVCGIEGAHKTNVVLWIGSMKAKLFMEFADRRLLRRFVPLEFTARKRDLSAVATALRALNQQHLAVVWMRINAVATTSRAAAPQSHRWHKKGGHHRNARIAAGRRIQVNRLEAWQAERGERLRKRKGECGETPRRIATERLLNSICESADQRVKSARPARCSRRAHGDPRRSRRAVVRWERLRLAAQGMIEHLADRRHRNDLQ